MFCYPNLCSCSWIEANAQRHFPGIEKWRKVSIPGICTGRPIVTAHLTVKIGLTVTNLLHEVDLVLGIN